MPDRTQAHAKDSWDASSPGK